MLREPIGESDHHGGTGFYDIDFTTKINTGKLDSLHDNFGYLTARFSAEFAQAGKFGTHDPQYTEHIDYHEAWDDVDYLTSVRSTTIFAAVNNVPFRLDRDAAIVAIQAVHLLCDCNQSAVGGRTRRRRTPLDFPRFQFAHTIAYQEASDLEIRPIAVKRCYTKGHFGVSSVDNVTESFAQSA